jgi:hypothetical protein
MPDIRRLERIEKKAEAQAPRTERARPMSYYNRLCAMTYEELEAEQARLLAGRERELKKLNGQLPPFDIQPDHPGWEFSTFERRSWLLDTVLGERLDKELDEIEAKQAASRDLDEQRRLKERYDALIAKLRALNARYDERDKWMKEREMVAAAARKEQCVSPH